MTGLTVSARLAQLAHFSGNRAARIDEMEPLDELSGVDWAIGEGFAVPLTDMERRAYEGCKSRLMLLERGAS